MNLTHEQMVEHALRHPPLVALRSRGGVEVIRIVTRDDRPNRADVFVKTRVPVEKVDLSFTLGTGQR